VEIRFPVPAFTIVSVSLEFANFIIANNRSLSLLRFAVSFLQKRGFPLQTGGSPAILVVKTWQYLLKIRVLGFVVFRCYLLQFSERKKKHFFLIPFFAKKENVSTRVSHFHISISPRRFWIEEHHVRYKPTLYRGTKRNGKSGMKTPG
jgi:hypothetical protein